MSEPTPRKREKQPTVTKIDPEVYRRLCEVVEAGTFQSVSFMPWHKGCDTELDTTCQWPELQDELENWYYDHMGDMESHTFAMIVPRYDGENLIFEFSGHWDRGRDGEAGICWDGAWFQEFVHNLLPSALRAQASPEELWISLEFEYESPGESSISGFSISLEGDEREDLMAAITPRNQKAIRDYIIAWCMENHSPEDGFSVSIETNEVASMVSSCPSEEFLLVPETAEETDL